MRPSRWLFRRRSKDPLRPPPLAERVDQGLHGRIRQSIQRSMDTTRCLAHWPSWGWHRSWSARESFRCSCTQNRVTKTWSASTVAAAGGAAAFNRHWAVADAGPQRHVAAPMSSKGTECDSGVDPTMRSYSLNAKGNLSGRRLQRRHRSLHSALAVPRERECSGGSRSCRR